AARWCSIPPTPTGRTRSSRCFISTCGSRPPSCRRGSARACLCASITAPSRSRIASAAASAHCSCGRSVSDLATASGAAVLPPRPRLYPERLPGRHDAIEQAMVAAQSVLVTRLARVRRLRLARIAAAVRRHDARLRALDDAALRSEAAGLRRVLRERPELDLARIASAFPLVREASARVLGLRHHDVQLVGAYALISGMIAEMETGEGKTLTAVLAAATMALAGHPVHVVTVNDYLVARDAKNLAPLYAFFGLTLGTVVQGLDPAARRAASACDVTYCTNKELPLPYLTPPTPMSHRPA